MTAQASPSATTRRANGGGTRAAVADALRTERIAGALLLSAALIAVVWANTPVRESYEALRSYVPIEGLLRLGPASFHLDLTLAEWTADALLAVFFFVVGVELKREFLVGSLRDPRRALVPILAAVGGMTVPAVIYAAITWQSGPEALRGWAVPTATDIAFALAVLGVVGSHLPAALRAFLLTLAVVDDLLAIVVIAVFYTSSLDLAYLALALVPLAGFGILLATGRTHWWLLAPLAVTTWLCVHESGVHATIAGVLLGLVVPVHPRGPDGPRLADAFEHAWRPFSTGVALPLYAFFAAGVSFADGDAGSLLTDTVAIGVVAGLVLGKLVGVSGTTLLVARLARRRLGDLAGVNLLGVSLLAGIGFTVSLLIGELAFEGTEGSGGSVTAAVLLGSLVSAVLAAVVLALRNRVYRRTAEAATLRDGNGDGNEARDGNEDDDAGDDDAGNEAASVRQEPAGLVPRPQGATPVGERSPAAAAPGSHAHHGAHVHHTGHATQPHHTGHSTHRHRGHTRGQ